MKKSTIIIILVILILLLIGLFLIQSLNNKQEESMPDIEQVGTLQENIINAEETSIEIPEKSVEKSLSKKPSNVIKRAVQKVQNKLNHEKDTVEIKETVKELQYPVNEEKTSKYTPEEEELLKKIPRSDEVVVDKEIKSKSSNRYIFK